jgi:hypothetical protein
MVTTLPDLTGSTVFPEKEELDPDPHLSEKLHPDPEPH